MRWWSGIRHTLSRRRSPDGPHHDPDHRHPDPAGGVHRPEDVVDAEDGCAVDMNVDAKLTSDDDIAALALFADVDFLDESAVLRRKEEWEALRDA